MLFKYIIMLSLALTQTTIAGQVLTGFPQQIEAGGSYVIYSHGLIVEGENPRPIHSKYGAYEFELIKSALAHNSDFTLIAEHRPKNTNIQLYTEQLVLWVRALLSAGVKPGNITLVGFSRGGELTARASSELAASKINTVLLATCWPGSVQDRASITFGGNFLSVYEQSDSARSCAKLAKRSKALTSFSELALSTGKEHGAFFTPLKSWVTPVKDWINAKAAE